MRGELAAAHGQYRFVPDQSDGIDQEGNSTAPIADVLRETATHIIVHQQIDCAGSDFGSVACVGGELPVERQHAVPSVAKVTSERAAERASGA